MVVHSAPTSNRALSFTSFIFMGYTHFPIFFSRRCVLRGGIIMVVYYAHTSYRALFDFFFVFGVLTFSHFFVHRCVWRGWRNYYGGVLRA